MLSVQLQNAAPARARTCVPSTRVSEHARAARRARHATGTRGGVGECSRHAVSTRILGVQPEAR
eukprot:15255434-Alexandrium_andersonii.AAC.1